MNNTVIIIPSRLGAKRFPNKPLAEINGLPMIVHCLNRATESKIGEAIVATPDQEIINWANEYKVTIDDIKKYWNCDTKLLNPYSTIDSIFSC